MMTNENSEAMHKIDKIHKRDENITVERFIINNLLYLLLFFKPLNFGDHIISLQQAHIIATHYTHTQKYTGFHLHDRFDPSLLQAQCSQDSHTNYKALTNQQPTYLYNNLSFPSYSVSTRSSVSLVHMSEHFLSKWTLSVMTGTPSRCPKFIRFANFLFHAWNALL